MSKAPKIPNQSLELIRSALEAILQQPHAKPVIAAEAPSGAGGRPPTSKGRRYSLSERTAILEAVAQGKTSQEILTTYGVHHETYGRWQRREKMNRPVEHKVVHVESLEPGPQANVTVSAPQEPKDKFSGHHKHWREVLTLWRSRPGLGPMQIKNQLRRSAGIKIHVATVRKIMEEHGYTPPKTAVKEVELNRYEAVRPLEIVHMDFKHFYINKQKVYLLLLQDDYSRFLCGFRMTSSENMKTVIEAFEECMNRYGKMQSLMTDAGSAFYSWNGVNQFQKLLSEEYGVDQIKAKTPRSNGKIENVNRQIEKEVLDVKRFASLEEAKTGIESWVRFYNFGRTHMGLPEGLVPADRFLYGWNETQGVTPAQESNSESQSKPEAVNENKATPFPSNGEAESPASDAVLGAVIAALERLKGTA